MAILPGYDYIIGLNIVSTGQIALLASTQYFTILLFGGLLFFTLFNFYRIIIKQRRYKTSPLLTFYILSVLGMILRLYTAIFLIPNVKNLAFTIELAQPICKLQIGLV